MKKVLSIAATLIGVVGVMAVSVGSFVWVNQPEVPAELLE